MFEDRVVYRVIWKSRDHKLKFIWIPQDVRDMKGIWGIRTSLISKPLGRMEEKLYEFKFHVWSRICDNRISILKRSSWGQEQETSQGEKTGQ
ncbi:unnamed protein product [Allacma fusca]|uniref:Uncharacterized protein n=1 Tax=Allacma fusca TaxID=39272 RepID=A0A8J2LEM1_9HEXA|nr:unnamed protein product [Allacma fusca]